MNKIKNFKSYIINKELLDVSDRNITSLDEILNGISLHNLVKLKKLYCYKNNLTSLPELPNGLVILSCYKNNLTSLPELPTSMTHLYVSENKLTSLPEISENIKAIYCENNNIKYLPELPDTLWGFGCSDNPLECIIPDIYLSEQSKLWLANYYFPYIKSYDGQKNILTRQPNMLNELKKQTVILPEIKKEFSYLFTGSELNLI